MPRLSNTVLNTIGQAGQGAGLFTVGQQLGGLGAKKRARDEARKEAEAIKTASSPVAKLELMAQQALERGDRQTAAALTQKAEELRSSGLVNTANINKAVAQTAKAEAETANLETEAENDAADRKAAQKSLVAQQANISSVFESLANDDTLSIRDRSYVESVSKSLKESDSQLSEEALKELSGSLQKVLDRNKDSKVNKTVRVEGGKIFLVDPSSGEVQDTGTTFRTPEVNKRLTELDERVEAAGSNASRYAGLATSVAERGLTETGTIGEMFSKTREALGVGNDADTLRRELEEIRVSGMIANLPPGVASDKDMELVARGAADFNSLTNAEAQRVLVLMSKAEEHQAEIAENNRMITSQTDSIETVHHANYRKLLKAREKSMNSLGAETYQLGSMIQERDSVRLKVRELLQRGDTNSQNILKVMAKQHPDIKNLISLETEARDLSNELNNSDIGKKNNWSF